MKRSFAAMLLGALLLAALPAPSPAVGVVAVAPAQTCWARLNDAPTDYPTVQAAVDASAAPTDVVKVAGYCAGVEQRAGLTQTVYLSKTLTLQGGYTVTNWAVPDPIAHPTTLDALGAGRALLITGAVTPTVAGLRLTGGDARRAGYDPYGQGRGGGLYAAYAAVTISGCLFYDNKADAGGGLYTYDSLITMYENIITGNAAPFFGGGMLMYGGAGWLEGNVFISNTSGTGGGAYFGSDAITLTSNAFLSNTAKYEGGGVIVEIYGGHSELVGNVVAGNRAYFNGGGLYFGEEVRAAGSPAGCGGRAPAKETCRFRQGSPGGGPHGDRLLFAGNLIAHNWTAGHGGGVYMGGDGGAALLVGNTVQENTAGGDGAGIYLDDSAEPTPILSNTVAANVAGRNGGGVFLGTTTATVRGNTVQGNRAGGDGGGGYGQGTWIANTVAGNEATGNGGGLAGGGALAGNLVISNTAYATGGGVFLYRGPTLAHGNTVLANRAADGGGFGLAVDAITLTDNLVASNRADKSGGGLGLYRSAAAAQANVIVSNEAGGGGGVCLDDGSAAVFVNNWIAANRASAHGSGLLVIGSQLRSAHNTIARNAGPNGLEVWSSPAYTSAIVLTDTILFSHTVGLYVDTGNTARLEATLWGNDTDWAGGGAIITGTVNVWGPPAFVDPDAGDYHLGPGSAAADAGVAAGITTDIDGDPRPIGAGYDIGADEATARLAVAKRALPAPVAAGNLLTYTLLLTNTGAVSLRAALSDTLPAPVTPTGVLTWSVDLAPGGVWTQTVVVTVAEGYAGPLVNRLWAFAAEGAAGRAAVTVTAVAPIVGLAAVNDGPTALGRPTTLTATVAAGTVVTYTWALGDGTFVFGPAALTHTYPAVGFYTAVVTASNPVSAATAGTVVEIVPAPGWRIYLPLVGR